MATKTKDAKAKTKTLEGAKKTQAKAKDELKAANAALTAFLKKNKLARDEDHSKDKKFGKEFKELTLNVGKANEAMDAANAAVDKFKGTEKKEAKGAAGAGRATKYDYPEGLTSKEKKEYRIKMRREAAGGTTKTKSDKKSDKAGKDKKSDKKAKNLAPVEKTTTTKKSKKKDKGSKKKSKKDND